MLKMVNEVEGNVIYIKAKNFDEHFHNITKKAAYLAVKHGKDYGMIHQFEAGAGKASIDIRYTGINLVIKSLDSGNKPTTVFSVFLKDCKITRLFEYIEGEWIFNLYEEAKRRKMLRK